MKYKDIRVISYPDMNEYERIQALNYMMLNDKLEEDYIKECIEGKIYDCGKGMFFSFNDAEVTGKGFLVMETIAPLSCAYIHKVSAIDSYFEDSEDSFRGCIEKSLLKTVDRLKAFAEKSGATDVRLGFSDNPSQLRLMELFKNSNGYGRAYRSFIMKLSDARRSPEADMLELRDIRELSMEEYAQLYNDSFEGAPHRSFMGKEEAMEAFSGKNGTTHFIVWDGAVKAGFLDFYEDIANCKGKFDLGIVKDKRGLGYGRRILETAIQHLAEKNLEVELIVLEPNTVAFEMYKKRGFEIRSIMGHWIRL